MSRLRDQLKSYRCFTGTESARDSFGYLERQVDRPPLVNDLCREQPAHACINEKPWPGGTIAQLASLGHRVEEKPPTEVGERLGTEQECELLGLEPGSWVKESFRIHIEQGAVFGSWRVLECAVHVYRLGEAVLVFNSVQGRRWNAGD